MTSNGTPEPGAHVDIVSGSFKAGTYTGPDGRYIVVGVPEGRDVGDRRASAAVRSPAPSSATLVRRRQYAHARRRASQLGHRHRPGREVRWHHAGAPLVGVHPGRRPSAGAGCRRITTDTAGRSGSIASPRALATINVDVLGSLDQGKTTVDVAGAHHDRHDDHAERRRIARRLRARLVGRADRRRRHHHGHGRSSATASPSTSGATAVSRPAAAGRPGHRCRCAPSSTACRSTAPRPASSRRRRRRPRSTSSCRIRAPSPASCCARTGRRPPSGTNVTLTLSGNRGADPRAGARRRPLLGDAACRSADFTARLEDPSTGGVWRVLGRSRRRQPRDRGSRNAVTLDDTPVAVVSIDPRDGATGVLPATTSASPSAIRSRRRRASRSRPPPAASVSALRSSRADGLVVTFDGTLPQSSGPHRFGDDGADRHLRPASRAGVHAATSGRRICRRRSCRRLRRRISRIRSRHPRSCRSTFNEPIVGANLQSIVTLTGPAGAVAGTTALTAPNVAVFTPAAPLATDAAYTVVGQRRDRSLRQPAVGDPDRGLQDARHDRAVADARSPAADGWSKVPRPTIHGVRQRPAPVGHSTHLRRR